ncbi:MAG: hypothetical protein V2J02_02625 [Pseudomonadales bacterium]|nr:hypothetical protein [Pseudomonadales bacterium]
MTGTPVAPSGGPVLPEPLRPFAGAAVELVRISQLVPMIVAWGLAALVVFMALLAVDDEAVLAAVERLWTAGAAAGGGGAVGAWVADFLAQRAAWDPETGHFDPAGLILGVWTLATLALFLPALLWERLRGPRPRPPLGRRLRRLGLACAVLWIGLSALRFVRPEAFSDGIVGWLVAFGLLAIGVFLASAWSLAVSTALGGLRDRLEGEPAPVLRSDGAGQSPEGEGS